MRPLVVLWWLLGGTSLARESAGIELYARGAYARAVRILTVDAEDPKATDAERALARVYLAASLQALHKDAEARQQLEQLARTHPAQQVDPALFPPELVTLDRAVRAELEVARLREEAQRAEGERRAAEAAAAERERLASEQREREAQAHEVQVAASEPLHWRLRPELVGYSNLLGTRSVGYGAGLSFGVEGLDLGVRVLPGTEGLGLSAEVGYLFGREPLQPRVALRGTHVRNVGTGGGGVAGLRWTPTHRVSVLMDVGVESFRVDPALFKPLVLTVSVGLGFNLL